MTPRLRRTRSSAFPRRAIKITVEDKAGTEVDFQESPLPSPISPPPFLSPSLSRIKAQRGREWQPPAFLTRGLGLSVNSRNSTSSFVTTRRMGIYEANHQIGMWEDSFKADSSQNTCVSTIMEADTRAYYMAEEIPHKALGQPKYDQEENKPPEKNREAARKSRMRKKAYVQQLESSRLKLAQLEQEVERARQQGMYIAGHLGEPTPVLSATVNTGIAAFEMEYGHWIEEQNRQTYELRSAVQAHISEIELHMLVETKSDVFYLMSGMWRTPTERFFLWIGGFRPSELLKALYSQLDPLSEQQARAVCSLQQSSQQAKDALSQGLEKLQQTLSETLTCDPLGTSGVANYMGQIANAMGKLEALVSFVNQADHLRQQTLQEMYNILTTQSGSSRVVSLRGLLPTSSCP
ncbi:transcription factor TGA4 [Canna indica]|uniref:Transcription factor TGA4 n=1 Tax=Canna indica TaxID=4628 RepID=A0AAQ3JWV5_9LILI|nr:transcription factor TGA4 [Canna indica]